MAQKTRGTIAAGHEKTAEAGIEMFRLGGNAFDAAVAAILASFVTEPGLTSAAGGGFLLAHTQANQNILFDFFTQTPCQKRNRQGIDFYPVSVNFGNAVQEFHIGLGSMAVPGNLAGVFHVHNRLGKLPLPIVAEPAIHYAKQGILLNKFQYYSLRTVLEPIIMAHKDGKLVFALTGEPINPGGMLMMSEFADTLAYLTKNGVREFYEGEIARQLVQDCQQLGGYLTVEDLKNYQVIEREPLTIDYRGNTLLTNPPPSSGGTLIACALKLLSQVDMEKLGFGSVRHLEILYQVMKLTNVARKDGYDAYLYQENIADKFLADEHLAQYNQQLTQTMNKWGSTTHISVIDGDGNAASVTTSNGEGSGYVIPGTGIMVNNMLGEEDLNPHGFHQWQENVRISSMMSPTIVLKNNQPEIVLGSGGSNRIRTAILQVISNILDFKLSVNEAVDSPRTHGENSVFHVEPGLSVEDVNQITLSANHQLVRWQEKNLFFGGVHTVMKIPDGSVIGAGDRRRDGTVASC
ncbi:MULTISPECIES: gamma-glutamyltransferase [unclassified Coleofasciculus]|uniref:gamma-glutamyltransferase n=1 Tax=unclassified Coleofasciculus TaxID=2692782 RepID=UPI001882F12B|nr:MULTISPECIES: gamma-glutamyltransferase [unclassified Coleofasciculus]MBE9124887.1 gamma-glutamyltransferase [Coleofasciculus sp. LEGE 07081]MBE9147869.1 gamma-glutamyltransferase [Coleofasciculus sp. LEGE 07092]